MRSRASILVGLLWCLALLSVVVVGVLHTARMDLLVVKNYGDRVQAHYLALAGVERAKALLYHDYLTRQQTAKNHTGSLYDNAKDFENVSFGRGRIRVFRPARSDEGGGLVFGISDEESRLNLNTASANELTNFDGLTPDIAASILAWRSDVNQGAAGGAEADYYEGLQPPYVPRNGPFQTVRELLLVRGVSRDLLLGGDVNQNDVLDSGAGTEDDASAPADGGWSAMLTVDSTGKNLNAAGKARVNVQTADQTALEGVQGFSPAIARAIIAYRGNKQLQSIADLLDVTPPTNTASARNNSSSQTNSTGQPVIDDQLLMQIADDVTVSGDDDMTGLVNINTAGPEVLGCLPGVDPVLARAIISLRKSGGFFTNVGDLLRVPGMTHDIFKQIAPLLTARSETFRICSEGTITSTGTRQSIQAIVHIASHEATTLAYREDL
jgi:competence ComEA-like helix-hairpin-helix protein